MKIYFISGVGADRRIFKNIELPEGYTAVHLDWIPPLKNESLQSYALRLAEKIDTKEPFALAGLSFGGMLANEIARKYPPVCVYLISSIPSSVNMPPYFRLAGKLGLEKLVPVTILKSASLLKRLFTAETKEEKKFLREAIRKADASFIRWSLTTIVNWHQKESPKCFIHIHGSRDFILPLRFSGATHVIKGEGHLMVLTKGKEIGEIIGKHLLKIAPQASIKN